MKQKKNDMVDRAEIIDDPTKRIEQLNKIKVDLSNINEVEKVLTSELSKIESELKKLTSHDKEIKKSDTVECIKIYFDKVIETMKVLDSKFSTIRERLYYIIYNISILFYDFVHRMRKNNYSIHGVKYLQWIITEIESNVVLSNSKYLKWRVKLYIELSFLYEDIKAYKNAYKVIDQAVTKLNDLKSIEEQQSPLPDYLNDIFTQNFIILKYFEFKYGILSGIFTFDVWKKKLDETFENQDEKIYKNICAINSISNLSWFHSIVNHDNENIPWKKDAVNYVYDLLKTDIIAIKEGILEYIEKKKNEFEYKKQYDLNQQKLKAEAEGADTTEFKESDNNNNNNNNNSKISSSSHKKDDKKSSAKDTKKDDGKKGAKDDPKKNSKNPKDKKGGKNAKEEEEESEEEEDPSKRPPVTKNFIQQSKNVPLELHIELLKAIYDCSLWDKFIEMIDCLNVRIKYRNVEIPYVADISIQMTQVPTTPPPKFYEKIPIDLNINNFKREIKRLREEGKYMTMQDDDEDDQGKDSGNKGKKAKTDNKKNPPPKKDDKKKPTQPEETNDETEDKYEPIEGMDHDFVYLLVKRSHNPNKALTNIRVVMSNEIKIKNELKVNERAIGVPIKTFKDNLYEENQNLIKGGGANNDDINKNDFTANLLNKATKMLPFVIIKKNSTALETDEERLSALIDVQPLITNCPYGEPPLNYIKLEPELSIPGKNSDPNYIKYNFDHNYINLCFKNDRKFYIIERESELLRNLYELAISYVQPSENEPPKKEDKKAAANQDNSDKYDINKLTNNFLNLNYSFEKLDILSTWLYNSIQGQIGEYFLENRSNFLYDICIKLWKKYLKDFLESIDYFYYFQDEIEFNLKESIMNKINSLKEMLFNSLFCIHHILTKIKDKDVIIYAYLSSRLADFAEMTGKNANGVLILRNTLDYIEKYKEDENIFGMNNLENKQTFTSFTCDNNKIVTLRKEINSLYDDYVEKLNLKRRVNYQNMVYEIDKNKPGKNLEETKKATNDEIKEEDFENVYLEKEYKNYLQNKNKDSGINLYEGNYVYLNDEKNSENLKVNYNNTEYENTLNCIYVDLCTKLYRMYIKSGDVILTQYDFSEVVIPKKLVNENNVKLDYSKLREPGIRVAENNLNKLKIIKGESAQNVKKNMEFLKHALQEAGKLEPDKPNLSKSEKMMELSLSKNSYLLSLYKATMALMRPNNRQDQIFLLREAAASLEQSFNEENDRMKYYKNYFFYIKSLERMNKNKNLNQYSYYPYSMLYKQIMIDKVEKIPEPILINKTSKTCTFLFPLISIKKDQLDKFYHVIPKVAMYGQMSTGSNCVQMNNNRLQNTGQIIDICNYLTIPNLKKNEKYIFAYAGYNEKNEMINQIGQTSKEVELYFPLPLFYISYHVCKVAYQFQHWQILKDRSKPVFSYFTERTDLRDLNMDNKLNTVIFYKLKYDFIKRTSFFELEGVSYCFFYFAKSVANLKPSEHKVEKGTNIYSKQKNILKNINVLTLGLEIAIYIRHYRLIKMFLYDLYNTLIPFLKNLNFYKDLLNVFLKMNLGINIIPSKYWEVNLRKISTFITYYIFLLSNSINEPDIIKKSLVIELGIYKKRYYPFIYKYMEKIEEDPKAKGKAPAKQEKKTPKDPVAKPQESINENDEKYEEVTSTSLKDVEREIIEIDEYLLSIGDYNDIVKSKLNSYLAVLDKFNNPEYSPSIYKDIQVEIENRKKDISELIEVYDGFKNEGIKYLQKYIAASKDKPKYYEYSSKLLRKIIQNFMASVSMLDFSQYVLTGALDGGKKGGGAAVSKDSPLNSFDEILKLVDDITINENDINFMQDIFNQKLQFLNGDILYKMKVRIHDYLTQIKAEMPKDKTSEEINLDKMGDEIEEKFFGCVVEEEKTTPYDTLEENDVIYIKEKLCWIADLLYNKGVVLYIEFLDKKPTNHQNLLNYDFNNFLNYKLCDLKKLNKFLDKINMGKILTSAIQSPQIDSNVSQKDELTINKDEKNKTQSKLSKEEANNNNNQPSTINKDQTVDNSENLNIKTMSQFPQLEDDLKLLEVRSGLFTKKNKPKTEDTISDDNKVDPKTGKKSSKPGTSNKKPANAKAQGNKNAKDNKGGEEEVLDPFDIHIERNFDARYQKLEKIFEKLSLSSLIMGDVENFVYFDKLISFVYNMILYDMLTPFDTIDNNIWLYLNIIAEVALKRIRYIKNGNCKYTEMNLNHELEKLKNRISDNTFKSKPNSFALLNKSSQTSTTKIDNEKIIEEYEKNINLDLYIEFICFVMQCTYAKQKWSILKNLIQTFNEYTNDLFAEFTLSYLIEAETNIYEKANLNTQNKQIQIDKRIQLYEVWKNSRKKNKRAQMITGEIPQEQLDFDRDYSILSKELHIFKSISDMLLNDKEKSQKLYESFLNDANNAMKSVNTCRKKYEEYQIELMSMKKYAYNFNVHFKEYQSKEKALSAMTNNMIVSYKNCIQILKKRQENYLLIQILYEMSLIMYSMKDIKNAEVYFNESLDNVFQRLYSIREFRTIFAKDANPAEKYGIKNLTYSILVLHKMAKFCYDNDLYNQRESCLMASEATFSIINNVIPNPQTMENFGIYRMCDININNYLFKTNDNIKVNDLLVSLIEMSDILISYGDYENCLPMLCLAEHLACDICKNIHYTLKSRVLRIVCLAELGYIHEAMFMFNKIIKKYDMPTFLNYGYKDFSIGKYANSNNVDVKYFNDLPPDDPKNEAAIKILLNYIADNDLKVMLGANLYYELLYMRLVILFKIYNKDNYKTYPDKSNFVDQRSENMIRIEKECRENIAMLSYYEDLCYLNNLLTYIKVYDKDMKNGDVIKAKIENILINARISNEEMNNFICVNFHKTNMELSKERYELIFKYRILLSRVFLCQGLYLSSSGVLLKSIENFKKMTSLDYKFFNFDNGEDYVFDFKQVDPKAANAKNAKPPAKQDKKQDNKKGGDKDKIASIDPNAPQVDPEEEFKKFLADLSKTIYKDQRIIPNSIYWFKFHYYHLVNLYKMGRYEDCLFIIKKFDNNCQLVNDVFYFIRCKEIQTMIYIQKYEIDNANKTYNEILKKGKSYFIEDYQICYFYANYAEYLYTEKNYSLAISTLKNARTIIWKKLDKCNYIINSQSIYSNKIIDNLNIDKNLLVQLNDKDNNYSVGGGGGQKKAADPKKGQATGNEADIIDYYDVTKTNNEMENFDKPKTEYVQGFNLYNRYTDLICKIEIKYALYQFMDMNNNQIKISLAESILKDLEVMITKQLFSHNYYEILINYIYGVINKIKFVEDLRKFLNEKFLKNAKLLKKNNLDVLTLNKKILFNFSNYYNEYVVSRWIPLLKEAKNRLEKALTISKTEFYLLENSFSLLNITSELADVNLLLAEYQINNKYKFCDILQIVRKIQNLLKKQNFYDKEDDDLPLLKEEKVEDQNYIEEKNNFISDKIKNENIEHINYLKGYQYYIELSTKISDLKRNLYESAIELASGGNLVDPSKLPKEIFLQILESDYLIKKKNKDFVQNPAIKPNIDSYDVFNLVKNYMKELDYFNFNFYIDDNLDEKIKNITKIHKFLKTNSSNYLTKCFFEYNIYPFDNALDNYSFIQNDYINVNYIMMDYELINHSSGLKSLTLNIGNTEEDEEEKNKNIKIKTVNLLYLLGLNSNSEQKDNNAPQEEEKGEKPIDDNDPIANIDNEVLFGRLLMKESYILDLNQKIYNMKIQMRQSMTFSEDKKNRDFKYYQIDYYNLIYDFIKEVLSCKKQFNDLKSVKENFTNEDIGEVNIEALDFWFNFLNFCIYTTSNPKFNALLRKIHKFLLK